MNACPCSIALIGAGLVRDPMLREELVVLACIEERGVPSDFENREPRSAQKASQQGHVIREDNS